MKIATLNHFEADFGADSLLQGLHYLAAERGWAVAEIPIIGHIHNSIDKGYLLSDKKEGFTGPTQDLARNAPAFPTMTEEEALDTWREFDLFVMTSSRAYSRDALLRMMARSEKRPEELPLVMCDFDDTEQIHLPWLDQFRPRVFFKRELVRRKERFSPDWLGKNYPPMWPLQFAAHYRNLAPGVEKQEKFLDIFCAMGRTHPIRDQFITALLEAIPKIGCSHYISYENHDGIDDPHGLIKGRQDWDGFMRHTIGARLSFAMRGYGRDTLHYWEGFMSGTPMMVVDPGLVIPYPFKEWDHYIPIEPPFARLKEEIFYTLVNWKDEELFQNMGKKAKAHCLKYHDTQSRAEYLIDIATRYIYGEKTPEPEEFGL